eukprot:SAG11_NODE_6254_length_1352_cov_0.970471_1_plen_136_part_00
MAGSIWVDVLRDLQLEAVEDPSMFADDAAYVYEIMANRTLPGRGMGGPGSSYFSSEVCPKSDNSPFQACSCTNCTSDPTTNPCNAAGGGRDNLTTGVKLQCKSEYNSNQNSGAVVLAQPTFFELNVILVINRLGR